MQDLERSAKIGREISSIEGKIASYMKGRKALDDAGEIIDLIEETEEEELVPELDRMMADAEKDIEEMRIRALLRGKYDGKQRAHVAARGRGRHGGVRLVPDALSYVLPLCRKERL